MDFLKAEIERKRKQLEKNNLIGPNKKFFKREELIKKCDEEYWKKYNVAEENKDEKHDEINQQSSNSSTNNSNDKNEDRVLPRKEVIRRLRERCEPIILFGETESESFARLRNLELVELEVNRGYRNDFQEAMEKVDQDYLEELVKSSSSNSRKDIEKKAHDVNIDPVNTTIEEIKQLSKNLGRQRKDEAINDCKIIITFFKFLLEMWGNKLNSRPDSVKITTQGKISSVTYTQTQTYLKPLFKQLKHNKIAEDILRHLIQITRYLLDRDYVKANDAYLQMAIGNAPWPIGVTMVGIHARTGREKIFAQNIAHVLNDETQRKYIQGLKRLMTQCQQIFPTDPSRCVEYNAINDQ